MTKDSLQISKTKGTSIRFKCLRCSAEMVSSPSAVVCPNCEQSWPITDGIPRFFQPSYYWGELPQEDALSFLEEVRLLGWREAATFRFKGNPALLANIISNQRASWFPLLGLDADSVALDIGSGHGAITHSLSSFAGQIYSLEAIPERVEFTRLRLSQEQIHNVQQLQCTALELPFCDESFDLIVVNGVLEWVGDWNQNGSARDVQIKFLRSLAQLLKPNGVLVIGIENRFGHSMFRGGIDHSGLRYTSLMPRKVATPYMRHFNQGPYRTTQPAKREYRTFTYSERGYRKLLKEAGIPHSSFTWSDPGYNNPLSIIPTRNYLLRSHILNKLAESLTFTWKYGWRHRIKRKLVFSGLLRYVVPDFLIFGSISSDAAPITRRLFEELQRTLPQVGASSRVDCTLSAKQNKTIIQVFDAETKSLQCSIKSYPVARDEWLMRSEFQNLHLVSDRLTSKSSFRVPKPIGIVRIGSCTYAVEGGAKGEQLSRFLFLAPERQRFRRLKKELPACVEVALQIAELMHGSQKVGEIDAAWWQMSERTGLQSDWDAARSRQQECVQHGDFTIENIFLDPNTDKLTIIDWDDLKRGLSPLYDVFSLLVSALPAIMVEANRPSELLQPWEPRFLAAFFGTGSAAQFYRELLVTVCDRLRIPTMGLWEIFLQFLALRTHYYASRESGNHGLYLKFMELAQKNSKTFVFATHQHI